MARPREKPWCRTEERPTVAQAIRRFCLECVGATSARGAFDCISDLCPLYPCMPFRGKAMPKSLSPGGIYAERDEARAKELASTPKRRPSLRLIHAQCRQCQPGDRTDCGGPCALYPYRPWDGPGKAPRRKPTEKQAAQLASARARIPVRIAETPVERGSTAEKRGVRCLS
jgi:hypothetical protein